MRFWKYMSKTKIGEANLLNVIHTPEAGKGTSNGLKTKHESLL